MVQDRRRPTEPPSPRRPSPRAFAWVVTASWASWAFGCTPGPHDATPKGEDPGPSTGTDTPIETDVPTTDTLNDAPDTAAPQPCLGCDDGDACNGEEACDADGRCVPGTPVDCGPAAACVTTLGEATCVPLCPVPSAPNVGYVANGDALTFVANHPVEVAVLDVTAAVSSALWTSTTTASTPAPTGTWRVLARTLDPNCSQSQNFDLVYTWADRFPGPAGSPTGRAWSSEDSAFVGWASEVTDHQVGADVAAVWLDTSRALGPASASSVDILALGEGGAVTLAFDPPIADSAGDDFAVFENGFSDDFLELAEVEVSSDGITYARFDTASHVPDAIGAFGTLDPRALSGFAGTVRVGFGVGFDLARLAFHPAVLTGLVDLATITHVRVIDVPGDGRRTDAWGRPVYDPWPTVGSAGFDLEAVGVLHQALP